MSIRRFFSQSSIRSRGLKHLSSAHKEREDVTRKKKVFVINTGGMMAVNNEGKGEKWVHKKGALGNKMSEMSELREDNMPEYVLHEWESLYWSPEMGPLQWKILAEEISQHYYDYDGFVITQGSDTMTLAASALSFMLENLGKPVIFTGAVVPFQEVYSDARRNLALSISLAATVDLNEVTIFCHDKLLRGNRSIRRDTDSVDGFLCPNFPPLATVGKNVRLEEMKLLPKPRGKFKIHTNMDTNVVALRIVPGKDTQFIRSLVNEGSTKGIVLQLFGTGNIPTVRKETIDAVKFALDAGIIVVVTSQCEHGEVHLGSYAAGAGLLKLGAVSANDMTLDSAFVKLSYLFGRGYRVEEIKKAMASPLRGELTLAPSRSLVFADGFNI